MPLYEYRCRDCGHQFEILQHLGEGAEGLSCTGCGAAALEKQFSTFATASGSLGAETGGGCEAADCGTGSGACCGGGCSWDALN